MRVFAGVTQFLEKSPLLADRRFSDEERLDSSEGRFARVVERRSYLRNFVSGSSFLVVERIGFETQEFEKCAEGRERTVAIRGKDSHP